MCLDTEMILMLFLIWIVTLILFIAGTIFLVVKIVKSGKLI